MIGKRIKQLRKSSGLTQAELGNKLGVIKQTVSSWENDVSSPNSDTLSSMARIFNVTVDYLLGNEKAGIDYANYQMDTSEFIGSFMDRLKEILKEKGIPEKDFSAITGFHPDDADAYLYGNRIPSIEDLIKLSGSLHVSADYLLGINEEDPISDTDRYFLKTLTNRERSIVDVYRQLNEDNQDIIVGEMKKCLKEQRYEDSVAAEASIREAK